MTSDRSSLLHRLSDAARSRVLSCGRVVHLPVGHPLIAAGAVETHLFLLESGLLRVHLAGGSSVDIGPGELVGEMAFLDNAPRRSDVTVAEAARVRRIDRQDLAAAFVDVPALLTEFLEAITALREQRRGAPTATTESAEVFVAKLVAEALRHRAATHPYLQALGGGALPDVRWALADFARQYSAYASHQPRYVTTVMSRLEKVEHRRALLASLGEGADVLDDAEVSALAKVGVKREWVEGVPRPALFKRFSEALGVSVRESVEKDQVVAWRELFLLVLQASAAEGVGAFGLGTELIIHTIHRPVLMAIDRLGTLSPRDSVVFRLSMAVGGYHQAALQMLTVDHARTPEGRASLRRGMIKALQLRSAFWDWMLARATHPAAADSVV